MCRVGEIEGRSDCPCECLEDRRMDDGGRASRRRDASEKKQSNRTCPISSVCIRSSPLDLCVMDKSQSNKVRKKRNGKPRVRITTHTCFRFFLCCYYYCCYFLGLVETLGLGSSAAQPAKWKHLYFDTRRGKDRYHYSPIYYTHATTPAHSHQCYYCCCCPAPGGRRG